MTWSNFGSSELCVCVCMLSFYRKMLLILVILYMHSYSTHNFPCHNFSCSLALCRQHIITAVIILLQHFFHHGGVWGEIKRFFGVNLNFKLLWCLMKRFTATFYFEKFSGYCEEIYRWNRHVQSQLRIESLIIVYGF